MGPCRRFRPENVPHVCGHEARDTSDYPLDQTGGETVKLARTQSDVHSAIGDHVRVKSGIKGSHWTCALHEEISVGCSSSNVVC